MSISRNYYVICGYDFTQFKDVLLADDWKWKEENEQYSCCQSKGNIQFFDDPMSGNYLYFGYILSDMDEYDDSKVTKINLKDVKRQKEYIDYKLRQMGWTQKLPIDQIPYEVISFVECC